MAPGRASPGRARLQLGRALPRARRRPPGADDNCVPAVRLLSRPTRFRPTAAAAAGARTSWPAGCARAGTRSTIVQPAARRTARRARAEYDGFDGPTRSPRPRPPFRSSQLLQERTALDAGRARPCHCASSPRRYRYRARAARADHRARDPCRTPAAACPSSPPCATTGRSATGRISSSTPASDASVPGVHGGEHDAVRRPRGGRRLAGGAAADSLHARQPVAEAIGARGGRRRDRRQPRDRRRPCRARAGAGGHTARADSEPGGHRRDSASPPTASTAAAHRPLRAVQRQARDQQGRRPARARRDGREAVVSARDRRRRAAARPDSKRTHARPGSTCASRAGCRASRHSPGCAMRLRSCFRRAAPSR